MPSHLSRKSHSRVVNSDSESDEIEEFTDIIENFPPAAPIKDRRLVASSSKSTLPQTTVPLTTQTNTQTIPRESTRRAPLKPTTSHNHHHQRQDAGGLEAALRATQLRLEAAQMELKKKDDELVKLKKDKSKRGSSHGKRHVAALKMDASQEEKLKLEIVEHAAKHFTGFVSIWIEPPAIINHPQLTNCDSENDEAGGMSHENLLANDPTARDIYNNYVSHFPAAFRAEAFSKDMTSTWLTAMGNIRSTWVNRLRGECCYDVFGPELGREIRENRATSEILCTFIGGRMRGNQVVYHQNGPFLFPDPSTPKDLDDEDWRAQNIFRNPLLMRAGRCVIFGPKSIVPGGRVSNKVYGTQWGVTQVTANFIACVSVLVAYAASPDTEFDTIGKPTTISYFRRFLKYLQLANDILDLPEGRETYDLWNRYIFKNVQSYSTGALEESDDADDLLKHIKARARLLKEMEVEVTNHNSGGSREHTEEVQVLPGRESELGMAGPDKVANAIGDHSNDDNRSRAGADPEEGFTQYAGREASVTSNDGESRRTPPVSQDHRNLLSSLSPLSAPSVSTHPEHKVHKPLRRSDDQIILPDPSCSPSRPTFIGTPSEYAALSNFRAEETRKRSAESRLEADDSGTASTAKRARRDSKPQPDNQVDVGIEDGSANGEGSGRSGRTTRNKNSTNLPKQIFSRLRKRT